MGKREQREQVFMLLFRVEFNSPEDMPEQVRLFFEDSENTILYKDADFITARYEQITARLTELDEQIDSKMEGWDVSRIGKVELTALRIAAYEILFDEEIPDSVAINEAVELAKKYGQESSGGFVNAILAKFVKQGE
ncbi:MAG: transcription antitermination factor NusB [Lachnospiraceae bacterium]|nr:transcription antitermination factor NusB [Lachnospiraceae bacterium]